MRVEYKNISSIIISVVATFLSFSVQATTIDFQQLEYTDSFNHYHGFQYIEDGFQIDEPSPLHGLQTYGTLHSSFTGSTAMYNEQG